MSQTNLFSFYYLLDCIEFVINAVHLDTFAVVIVFMLKIALAFYENY